MRGALWLLGTAFKYFTESEGRPTAAIIVGVITFSVAFLALLNLKETFGKDLDYLEEK